MNHNDNRRLEEVDLEDGEDEDATMGGAGRYIGWWSDRRGGRGQWLTDLGDGGSRKKMQGSRSKHGGRSKPKRKEKNKERRKGKGTISFVLGWKKKNK